MLPRSMATSPKVSTTSSVWLRGVRPMSPTVDTDQTSVRRPFCAPPAACGLHGFGSPGLPQDGLVSSINWPGVCQARRVFFLFCALAPAAGSDWLRVSRHRNFARRTMLWCGLATLSPFQPVPGGPAPVLTSGPFSFREPTIRRDQARRRRCRVVLGLAARRSSAAATCARSWSGVAGSSNSDRWAISFSGARRPASTSNINWMTIQMFLKTSTRRSPVLPAPGYISSIEKPASCWARMMIQLTTRGD